MPAFTQGCPGKIFLPGSSCRTRGKRFSVVLRGLDPRIHVFVSTAQGVDGRAKPGQDENWAAISLPSSPQDFPDSPALARASRGGASVSSVRSVLLAGPFDLDVVVFGDRVGEQLLAHRLGLLAEAGRIGLAKFDLDQLALAHLADAVEPKGGEGIADRLALRIENARLQRHPHAHFHVCEPWREPVITSRHGVASGSHSAKRNTGRRSTSSRAGRAISPLDTVP